MIKQDLFNIPPDMKDLIHCAEMSLKVSEAYPVEDRIVNLMLCMQEVRYFLLICYIINVASYIL